ncbi:hypothetical protein SD81_003945 [Tolypothrix campylonemoides VB511288]|nr:hypothetical protein SD81_003945 [Tolypothrix campylonemoides VB511288]
MFIHTTKSDLDELFKDYGEVQTSKRINDQGAVFVQLDKNPGEENLCGQIRSGGTGSGQECS